MRLFVWLSLALMLAAGAPAVKAHQSPRGLLLDACCCAVAHVQFPGS
jgi:hypothetical protein